MRALMLWLLMFSGCFPLVRDWNSNGVVLVAALGDSNTYERPDGPAWCDRLAAAHSGVEWHCVGIGGMQMTSATAWDNLEAILTDAPDVVILAGFTNDVLHGATADEMVSRARQMCERVEATGAVCVPALVPRLFYLGPSVNDRVEATNALLVARQSTVLDFYSDFVVEDYAPDGIHFTSQGSAKRMQRAEAVLW